MARSANHSIVTPMREQERTIFLDCPFDRLNMDELIQRCLEWCRKPRQSHTIVTVNARVLVMLQRDRLLREACMHADLVVADGMPIVWGAGLPQRLAGIDIMTALLAMASEKRLRVYFLGGMSDVVGELVHVCRTKYPGVIVAGFRDGYFDDADHPQIVSEIRCCRPDLLFVGMPSPSKETWSQRYRQELDIPVIIGVGGSFDVLSGFVRRSPLALQKIGLEWAWRVLMEPRRLWKRYLLSNTAFAWLTLRSLLRPGVPTQPD
jgi:N-acetylglucosaminyldiphosphoundecaprenol N-acetyl-beta-D-mannosaminyltransferase